MKQPLIRIAVSAIALVTVAGTALAQTSKTFTPTPADLYDLDHHSMYTWRVDNAGNASNLNLTAGNYVSAATLTITNIANWQANEANQLFIHLFDTARSSGVAQFYDEDPGLATVSNNIQDDFISGRYPQANGKDASGATKAFLIDPGTQGFRLAAPSNFPNTPQTYTLNFNDTQLYSLENYIRNGGNFALGFDPDCHFYNDGVSLKVTTSAGPRLSGRVPEPATGLLVLAGLGAFCVRRRKA